jgi:hypothetical protein
MKSFKKYLWILPVLCAMIWLTIRGINQARHKEWEQLQSGINISAKEVIQTFEEGGIHLENIEDITSNVAKELYGEPSSAFSMKLKQEKKYTIGILEYPDWRTANHILEYQKEFLRSNSSDYEGGLFLHGAVLIFIYPPDENLHAQFQQILMDRYNLTKEETQTK